MLISKAFALAASAQISLDTLVDAQGNGTMAGGAFAGLAPLLFSPQHTHPCNVGPPAVATDFPLELCTAVHRNHTTLNDGWVFGRCVDLGVLRFFASPAVERDIATVEEMDTTFRDNTEQVINLILPEPERARFLHAVGSQVCLRPTPMPLQGLVLSFEPLKCGSIACLDSTE